MAATVTAISVPTAMTTSVHHHDRGHVNGRRQQAGVAAYTPHSLTVTKRHSHEATVRRVHHPQTLRHTVSHPDRGTFFTIDKQDVAFTAVEMRNRIGQWIGRKWWGDLTVLDQHIVQHENVFIARPDTEHLVLARILNHQGSVETSLKLFVGIEMRVIPEQARRQGLELISESATRWDRILRNIAAVLIGRQLDAMPVNGGGVGQVVDDVDHDRVADIGPNGWPR